MKNNNISGLIQTALDGIDMKKKVEEQVQKAVDESISSSVRSAFGSYSEFQKGLEKMVKEQAQINLDRVKLPEFSTILLNAVKGYMNEDLKNEAERLKTAMNKYLIGEFVTEMKLSEFIHKIKELHVNEIISNSYDFTKGELEGITLHIDPDIKILVFVDMSLEPDKSKYECDIKFHIGASDGILTISQMGDIKAENVYQLKGLTEVQLFLFKCHTRGMKITELDVENIQESFDEDDYKIDWQEQEMTPSNVFKNGSKYLDC